MDETLECEGKMKKKSLEADATKNKEKVIMNIEPVNTKAVTAQTTAAPVWGAEGITSQEITIPKMLLMQGLSKLVADGEAAVGQIRDSLTGELLGGKVNAKEEKAVNVIPFYSFRTWVVSKLDGEKWQYARQEPITAANENAALEGIEDGVRVRRDKVLNFYVMRPEDVAKGSAFPYLLSFRRTSAPAGRNLSTYIFKGGMVRNEKYPAGKPSAATVFALTVEKQENDKGTFFVPKVAVTRDSTDAEIAECKDWHALLARAVVKHDDRDLTGEAEVAAAVDNTDF